MFGFAVFLSLSFWFSGQEIEMEDFSISLETFTQTRHSLVFRNNTTEQKLVEIVLNNEVFRLAILDAGEERVLILPEELSIIENFEISEVEDNP